MKRHGFTLIAFLSVALGVAGYAQSSQSSPQSSPAQQSAAERTLYRQYYNAVKKKDDASACTLAQEFLTKFPHSRYAQYVRRTMEQCRLEQFHQALSDYYKAPDAAKLDALLAAGERILKDQPDQLYVTSQLAIAMSRGAISGSFRDLERAKAAAQQTLNRLDSPTPPEGWQAEQYNALREAAQAQLNQFLGWDLLHRDNPDPEQAATYLTRAIEVRNKDGMGWKDPNNYWLRADTYTRQYAKVKAQYDALSDAEKNGEQGKALLVQVDALVDRMIGDYARVVALATQPQTQPMQQSAREHLEQLWKYRHDGRTEGLEAYILAVQKDPAAVPPTAEQKGK